MTLTYISYHFELHLLCFELHFLNLKKYNHWQREQSLKAVVRN